MRIQCDVCKKEEASVFCCADEASLCETCDRRVHRANKLAGKHRRFSLLYPITPAQPPKCDVCQDKRAFLFCQEDRAILCRDCDVPIHSANEHTMKHNRFLLTGVKLSSTVTPAGMPEEEKTENKKVGQQQQSKQAVRTQSSINYKGSDCGTNNKVIVVNGEEKEGKSGNSSAVVTRTTTSGGGACVDSSSISDYLINTLPGWCVDDLFLDDLTPSSSPFVPPTLATINKMGIEAGIEGGEEFLQWSVPQVLPAAPAPAPAAAAPPPPPQPPPPQTQTQTSNICFQTFHHNNSGIPSSAEQHQWNLGDDGFTVPQMDVSQSPLSNKRSRSLWFT